MLTVHGFLQRSTKYKRVTLYLVLWRLQGCARENQLLGECCYQFKLWSWELPTWYSSHFSVKTSRHLASLNTKTTRWYNNTQQQPLEMLQMTVSSWWCWLKVKPLSYTRTNQGMSLLIRIWIWIFTRFWSLQITETSRVSEGKWPARLWNHCSLSF